MLLFQVNDTIIILKPMKKQKRHTVSKKYYYLQQNKITELKVQNNNNKLWKLDGCFPKRPSCHWMETIVFFTGRWDHKLELSQKVLNSPSAATLERELICLKWWTELLNLVKGLSHTMINLEFWPWPDRSKIHIANRHIFHLCRVICKSLKGFKRYRVDMKAWLTDGHINNFLVDTSCSFRVMFWTRCGCCTDIDADKVATTMLFLQGE